MTNKTKKSLWATTAIMSFILTATQAVTYAQGDGLAGISQATAMVTSYFEPISQLMYAVGAVMGLIGGLKVYSKMQAGDPDGEYEAMQSAWVKAIKRKKEKGKGKINA